MQLFFPCFSANVCRVQVLSDEGRQPLRGKNQIIAQGFRLTGGKEGRERAQLGLGGNQLSVGNSLHTDL